jgi:hypothetical protein
MLPLTRTERAVWLRFLAYETRTDAMGARAQEVICNSLTKQTIRDEGTWCDCPEHNEAMAHVISFLWRKQPE